MCEIFPPPPLPHPLTPPAPSVPAPATATTTLSFRLAPQPLDTLTQTAGVASTEDFKPLAATGSAHFTRVFLPPNAEHNYAGTGPINDSLEIRRFCPLLGNHSGKVACWGLLGCEFSLVLLKRLLKWIGMADIKGLYRNQMGYYLFQPSGKGLPAGARRPKVVSLGTKDENEALRRLTEIRGGQVGQGSDMKLREWVALYLEERVRVGRHSARTNRQMTQSLGRALDWFGDVDPRSITRADVMAFYAAMQEGRTHGTVHQYLRYLRAVFFWLKERKAVVENPAAQLRLPVVRQTRRDRFCTPAERDALLEACDRDDIRFVLMCGFFLGMRINEIVNARWRWFSAKSCTIQGEQKGAGSFETKTRKSRMVPLHSTFSVYLSGLPRGEDDAFVLHPEKKQGRQWLRWDPRKGFKALTKACGVPWVTPHTMRHTFGSLHAMAGTPELKIRRWMGITQQTLDRHYAGLSHDDSDVDSI